MRRIYVIPAGSDPANYAAAAASESCTEIVVGVPPRLAREGFSGSLPRVYVEPDDPERAPFAAALTQLKNTFNTPRNAAQINNSIDALTILMKKVVGELRD